LDIYVLIIVIPVNNFKNQRNPIFFKNRISSLSLKIGGKINRKIAAGKNK